MTPEAGTVPDFPHVPDVPQRGVIGQRGSWTRNTPLVSDSAYNLPL